jgi:hypothetical protein
MAIPPFFEMVPRGDLLFRVQKILELLQVNAKLNETLILHE